MQNSRTISVNGNAEVRVAPDIVQLLLAVETTDKTIPKAKQASDERVAKTLAVANRLGIPAKDIQTDRMSIDVTHNDTSYSSRGRDPDGYVVRRSIVLTLRDVKRFEEAMTAVLEAGTNRVDGIDFQTSELRKHRDQARAQALKAAREKAAAMAAELGMKIGKASSIQEGYSGAGLWGFSRRNMMQQNVSTEQNGGAESGTEGFAPGLISVSAAVSVTFDLE